MLRVFLHNDRAKLPTKAHTNDAGWDLTYAGNTQITIEPHQSKVLETGLSIAFEPGSNVFAMVANRSSVASKFGLIVGACVIDPGYIGELKIHLINTSDQPRDIQPGMRIAQLLLLHNAIPSSTCERLTPLQWQCFVSNISTTRGQGGFGSSGQ